HLLELVLEADPELLAEITRRRLAALADEAPASRRRLEDTLRAWLRHAGSRAAVAAELHIHPQTVHYRLTRLRELLGADLESPRGRIELQLALEGRDLRRP